VSGDRQPAFQTAFKECIDPKTGQRYLDVYVRGSTLSDMPSLNKGTAFSDEERDALGLRGLMPPQIANIDDQVRRVLDNYANKATDLERYIHLNSLLDRNETLFFRVLTDRIEELLPIIYTPTVGLACQRFGRIYRRHRGLYITPSDLARMDGVLANWPHDDVEIVVVTDGERILGLGDLGAGGMGISIGKSALYTAGAGIRPWATLPVCLDVGTDNEALRRDPLYLGEPVPRLRGPAYDELVDAFVTGVSRRFPRAIIQFEDFGKNNAFRLLEKYKDRARCFNDDIQGTGAVTFAGVLSGLKKKNARLQDQRVFIIGAGSAGVGIARMLEGAEIWAFDSQGLITCDRRDLRGEQAFLAKKDQPGTVLEVAKRVRPTIVIGVSGRPKTIDRALVETMGPAPLIFPLSNPTASSECTPAEAMEWTNGQAIVATGSPFPGTPQCNNMYIFPGVGLGVIASGAARVTDDLFRAAAERLSELASDGHLYPPLREIRRVSKAIAFAVAKRAVARGLAPSMDDRQIEARIDAEVWEPKYIPYRPATL
jgi:malate dehydrogenase (oxaloacetate-decarboxylating)(NADP+)